MPGPGRTKAKPKSSVVSSSSATDSESSNQLDTFARDVDPALDGWTPLINSFSKRLDLPDISTRSGLKKVHANFDSIYRRLDKAYKQNASNALIRGCVVGIYARLCVDSLLRNRLFRKGFLGQLIPLVDIPSCRHLALRALTTVTHHGGVEIRMAIAKDSTAVLLRALKDFPDDMKTAELSIVTLSHCLDATFSDDGMKLNPRLGKSFDLGDVVHTVTAALRKPSPPRPLVDHAVQLLAMSTRHCKLPSAAVHFLVAALRSKDWIIRVTCLGGLIRLHQAAAEDDQRELDPNKFMASLSTRGPPHLDDIIIDYGFQRSETFLTLKTSSDFQRAMTNSVQTGDLYVLGKTLAELILRTEFSISNGMFQTETGEPMEFPFLPFTMWSDALPHCAKTIRAKGVPAEADMADILDMKFLIMRQRIPEAVKIAAVALKRNPDFAYAYYTYTLASDPVAGLRAAKKGGKCANITPFVRFQMMQRAVQQAGDMGIHILQEVASEGDPKWHEGIAFLNSALEDAKTYLAEAPPDNRHMKNVLYWNILLRITMDDVISADLRELQNSIKGLEIADDFSKRIGVTPPKTALRLTQQTVVKTFSAAQKDWGAFFSDLNSESYHQPTPSAEKLETDLAEWLGDMDLEDKHTDVCRPSVPVSRAEADLYRCSWCGNPSAVLRKCSGCSKTRYCDAACQKLHWKKDHKKNCTDKTND